MKCGLQHKASKFALKSLQLLMATPGLTAGQFAAVCWPHLHKAELLAALNLGFLVRQKLIFCRFEPPFWKPGPVKPRKRYYVTDKGYSVHEFYARQLRDQDGDAPHHDRTR